MPPLTRRTAEDVLYNNPTKDPTTDHTKLSPFGKKNGGRRYVLFNNSAKTKQRNMYSSNAPSTRRTAEGVLYDNSTKDPTMEHIQHKSLH